MEELRELAGVLGEVAAERNSERLDGDFRLAAGACRRARRARERAQGRPFARRAVNARLRNGEHRVLMHQQW